jgi:hypothetical protein
MPKDQLSVLANAQRFLLSLKGLNPWEGEIIYFKAKNKELERIIEEQKEHICALEQDHVSFGNDHLETRPTKVCPEGRGDPASE